MKKMLFVLCALALTVSAAAFETEIPENSAELAQTVAAALPAEGETITLDKDVYAPGENITIDYTNSGDRKWFGLFVKDASNSAYMKWDYTTGETGQLIWQAPAIPGEYEIRYFLSDNKTVVAAAGFTVTGDDVSIGTAKNTYYTGEKIKTNNNTDQQMWFCIADTGVRVTSGNYTKYRFADSNGWANLKKGENLTTNARAPREAGSYELQFFWYSSYIKYATCPITVLNRCSIDKLAYTTDDNTITVTLAEAGIVDSLAIYDVNDELICEATDIADDATAVTFDIAEDIGSLGSYELRVFAEGLTSDYVEYLAFDITDKKPPIACGVSLSESKGGIRFKASVNNTQYHTADEYGFIISRKLILNKLGAEDPTFELKYPTGVGIPETAKPYSVGVSYNKEQAIDLQVENDDEGNIYFGAIAINIPDSQQDDVLVGRPYIRYGSVILYGESRATSINDLKKPS